MSYCHTCPRITDEIGIGLPWRPNVSPVISHTHHSSHARWSVDSGRRLVGCHTSSAMLSLLSSPPSFSGLPTESLPVAFSRVSPRVCFVPRAVFYQAHAFRCHPNSTIVLGSGSMALRARYPCHNQSMYPFQVAIRGSAKGTALAQLRPSPHLALGPDCVPTSQAPVRTPTCRALPWSCHTR